MGILLVYDVTDERSFNSEFRHGPHAPSVSPFGMSPTCRRRETDRETPSLDIRTWFSNVEQHASEGVNKILIGNKCDWEEKRVVSTEQGQALADELGIPFLEVSAKSNINIDKAFYSLAADIKKRLVDNTKNDQQGDSVNVGEKSGSGRSGPPCC